MTIHLAHKAVLAFIRGSSPAALEIDYMEYASNSAAQGAYVTSATAYTAQYPTAHNTTYVKSTTEINATYAPYNATNPALSLTGTWGATVAWLSTSGVLTNQRFHIDLGSSKIINKIRYDNAHDSGSGTDSGANNFILQGSNTGAGTFDDLVYANDEGWTQITGLSQSTFDEHIAADQADTKYITISGNTTAYRYYAIKIADNHGAVGGNYIGLRHIELQTTALNSFSESTIKTQGSYALKLSATTDALNEDVSRTLTGGDKKDLTGKNTILMDVRSTDTGSNLEFNIHDSGGTTSTHSIDIVAADTYQAEVVDISDIADADKDDIDLIQFKVLGTASYPPAQDASYVKATSDLGNLYYPYLATDPALSLTGLENDNIWLTNTVTNQRFHIDTGSARVIDGIYYENEHNSGAETTRGLNNFTLWGSNSSSSFDETTYATDTGWTQITGLSQTSFDEHIAADQADPKYITITGNSTPYRYYAFKIADNHGNGSYFGVRHIELRTARTFYIDNIRASADEYAYLTAEGGTITYDGDYKIHTFTEDGTFTVKSLGSTEDEVEYLVVGGGGGGGSNDGGGGGAGGLLTASGFAVTIQGYSITVGAAGVGGVAAGVGGDGGDSIFSSFTSTGGGGGGAYGTAPATGGSGGGASGNVAHSGAAGTGGQGSAGGDGAAAPPTYTGGGGGGKGSVGANATTSDAGNGGSGYDASDFGVTANSGYVAGGGGGAASGTANPGSGAAGGGNGAFNGAGSPADANSGSGGGGGNSVDGGGSGGSGIVILKYQYK
jgi:hypothetical protein